jgi:hypothetical protein
MSEELIKNFSLIKEKYYDLQSGKVSVSEFKEILLPFLTKIISDRNYKKILGDTNIRSLNLLLINIQDKFNAYEYQNDLGNEQVARQEQKNVVAVATRIVNRLEDVIDTMEKIKDIDKNQITLKNEINETIPLTKIDREKEATWTDLLYSIKEKKCIPFIGQEASLQWFNELNDLSSNWAKEYQYPLNNYNDLSSVSNFLAIENGNNIVPKNDLSRILSKIKPPDFSQEEYDNTPYSVLSKLPLPIYITTNYDHFMEAALISRGRQPVSDFCRWSDYLLKDEVYSDLSKNFSKSAFSIGETNLNSVLEQGSDYKPTVERPLVYHLYGDIAAPQSMVLTEKDYFDFVINLNKNDGKTLLNPFIYRIITYAPLLFIGYTLNNLFFRLLLKSLSEKSHLSNSVIVLPSLSNIENNKRAEEYFTKYVKDMFNASAFWIDNNDFSKELRARWNKFKM